MSDLVAIMDGNSPKGEPNTIVFERGSPDIVKDLEPGDMLWYEGEDGYAYRGEVEKVNSKFVVIKRGLKKGYIYRPKDYEKLLFEVAS